MAFAEISCTKFEISLDAYHDGELDVAEREAVEKHLANCPACNTKLADIDRLVSSLKHLPRVGLKRDFSADLDSLLSRQTSGQVVFLQPKVWAPLSIAAAVILLVLTFKLSEQPGHNVVASRTAPATVGGSQSHPVTASPQEQIAHTAPLPDSQKSPSGTRQNSLESERPQVAHSKPEAGESPVIPSSKQAPQTTIAAQAPADESVEIESGSKSSENMEIAEVAYPNGSFTEAVGIATDEDGLYDLKM